MVFPDERKINIKKLMKRMDEIEQIKQITKE